MGSSPAQQISGRTASSACRRDGRSRSTAAPSRDVQWCSIRGLTWSLSQPSAEGPSAPQTALGRRPGRVGFGGWDVAMLEQIKRATEVDADVIGDRLSAVENIIRVWSGGGRCIEDRRRRTCRTEAVVGSPDRGGRIVMTNCRNGGGRCSKRCGPVAHGSLRFNT